ncbi:uncharacterized protein C3orf14 homolog isoform X4 [Alligator sinensis]|uniref:Uncharacterized protein C3orf14 homolog isoform X4 n=1 Tax=Alligator sinensis TaxID=38654 RepID=A0A3Q0G567_ALLSI|nr:uncharacterized protein C3orf14 homolog isoform X4 [Alligator sinensis]
MASYLAKEVQLARRHEEILSQRSVLLQQMENHLGNKETEKTWQAQAADAAYKRNAALLNTVYWASVEEALPKWEQFLLGRAQTPVGFKKMNPTKQNNGNSSPTTVFPAREPRASLSDTRRYFLRRFPGKGQC